MSNFWLSYIAGLASGLTIALIAIVLRRVRKQTQDGSRETRGLQLNINTIISLGMLLVLLIIVVVISTLAFVGKDIPGTFAFISVMLVMFLYWRLS